MLQNQETEEHESSQLKNMMGVGEGGSGEMTTVDVYTLLETLLEDSRLEIIFLNC